MTTPPPIFYALLETATTHWRGTIASEDATQLVLTAPEYRNLEIASAFTNAPLTRSTPDVTILKESIVTIERVELPPAPLVE